jgi:DNA anti-recombination protein RmuC
VSDLEKEMKKIKTVADKHWPYDDWKGTTTDKEKQEYFVPITKAMQEVAKENTKDAEDQKDQNTQMQDIMVMLYDMASSDSKKAKDMKDVWDSEFKDMTSTKKKELSKTLKDFIKMIDKQVKMFTDASKTDIMKEASKESKQVLEYLICLFTQWKLIFTAVNSALEKGAGKEKKEEE